MKYRKMSLEGYLFCNDNIGLILILDNIGLMSSSHHFVIVFFIYFLLNNFIRLIEFQVQYLFSRINQWKMALQSPDENYHEVCHNYLSYSAISAIVSGKGS